MLHQTELEMAVTRDGPRLKLSVPQGVAKFRFVSEFADSSSASESSVLVAHIALVCSHIGYGIWLEVTCFMVGIL